MSNQTAGLNGRIVESGSMARQFQINRTCGYVGIKKLPSFPLVVWVASAKPSNKCTYCDAPSWTVLESSVVDLYERVGHKTARLDRSICATSGSLIE